MSVLIETTIGDLVFDLYIDKRPKSCLNFLKLCKIKYYNYCLFHSIRRNFIAQCGDPTGTGRGGESVFGKMYGDQAKYFELELKPKIKHQSKGTISFVNNGNNMHGSQFFITLGDGLDFLDGKHTVFGKLTEGFETLEKLNETICDDSHRAYQDVRISHTIVIDDPFDDPKGLIIPENSPEPTKEQLDSGRIRADEDLDAEKAKSKDQIQREIEDKELKIGTKILETIGDIGDAEEKPPENVLFVCKLNPVTNEDDLKIIFSRFGKILSCEIIKDQKTGDSLCYGFIEFKEVESCERAYFKMDNVLIDDRRIHVDFCQSLAKIKKFHKTALQKMSIKEDKSQGYKLKQSKPTDKKYSMVFDEDSRKTKNTTKPMYKPRSKREYSSESDSDNDGRKKKQKGGKVTEKRRTSTSSSADRSPSPQLKKKGRRRSDSFERTRKNKRDEKPNERRKPQKSYDRDHSSDDDDDERNRPRKKANESFNKKKSEGRSAVKSRRSRDRSDSDRSPSRSKRRNRSPSLDRKYSQDRKKKTANVQKKRAPSSSGSESEPEKLRKKLKRQSLNEIKNKRDSSDDDEMGLSKKEKSRRGQSCDEQLQASFKKSSSSFRKRDEDDIRDAGKATPKTTKKKPVGTGNSEDSDHKNDQSLTKPKQKSRDTPPSMLKAERESMNRKSITHDDKKDKRRYSDDYSNDEKGFNKKKTEKVPFSDEGEPMADRKEKSTITKKSTTKKAKQRREDESPSPKAGKKKTTRRKSPSSDESDLSDNKSSPYKDATKKNAYSSASKTKKHCRADRSDTEDYAKTSVKKTTKRRRDDSSSDESVSKRRYSSSDESTSRRRPTSAKKTRTRRYSSSDDASRKKSRRKTSRYSSLRSPSTSG